MKVGTTLTIRPLTAYQRQRPALSGELPPSREATVHGLGNLYHLDTNMYFSLVVAYFEAPLKVEEKECGGAHVVQDLGGAKTAGKEDQRPERLGGTPNKEEKEDICLESLQHCLACNTPFTGLMTGVYWENATMISTKEVNDGAEAAHDHSDRLTALHHWIFLLRPLSATKKGFGDLCTTSIPYRQK